MRHVLFVPLFAAATIFTIVTLHRAARAAEPVTATQLRAIVDRQFSQYPDYKPGDLISRRDIEPIVEALIRFGAISPDNVEDLYQAYLPNSSPLVKLLHTQAGTAFMRKVSATPGVYDRLERLCWMPAGRELLSQMIASPEGDKMFANLMTDEGQQALVKNFKDDSRIEDFMLPTGHVHTTDELVEQLGEFVAKNAK